MKKILALILGVSITAMAFVGCSEKKSDDTIKGETLKTGLAVITSSANSTEATDKNGSANIYSTVAAVTVDKDGKLNDVVIDVLQSKVAFTNEGKIATDLKTSFKTKKELGNDYGMKGASSIGKEWFEQAKTLEEYFVGKTADEIKGIAIEEKKPTDKDLASGVTIKIVDYIEAVTKAMADAKEIGAVSGNKLKLGVVSDISGSKDAGDEDGKAYVYTYYTALTLGNDKITSSVVDASQGNVTFNKEGKITSDITALTKSKNELGNDYGMKAISPIGKEWFEQSESFCSYIKGKKASEVKGISLKDGVATDKDLASSVTIGISNFIDVVEKAAK